MAKIIDLNDQTYDKDIMLLERFTREIESRQTILALMVDMGMKNGESFQEYFNELISFKQAYEIAKKDFYNNILIPLLQDDNYTSWNLDFENREVTLNE